MENLRDLFVSSQNLGYSKGVGLWESPHRPPQYGMEVAGEWGYIMMYISSQATGYCNRDMKILGDSCLQTCVW